MLKVEIYSSSPIFVTAKPFDIADIFARAGATEQAEILRLALTQIRDQFPMQADYICMELAKPEHDKTRELLAYLLQPAPVDA
jgi:hypothetical protein